MNSPGAQSGLTLVELIIALTVSGIILTGVMLAMNYSAARSADPLVQAQALNIARSYIEEISARPFTDPLTGEICNSPAPPASQRPLFNNICDYQALSGPLPPADQYGNPVAELAAYQVGVSISTGSGDELNGLPDADVLRIRVDVSYGSFTTFLTAYRSRY